MKAYDAYLLGRAISKLEFIVDLIKPENARGEILDAIELLTRFAEHTKEKGEDKDEI